jgi:hypothetical protein
MKSYIPRKDEIKSSWHVLDAEGRVSGLYVEFQRRRSVEQMLAALRTVLPLDVRDRRP